MLRSLCLKGINSGISWNNRGNSISKFNESIFNVTYPVCGEKLTSPESFNPFNN